MKVIAVNLKQHIYYTSPLKNTQFKADSSGLRSINFLWRGIYYLSHHKKLAKAASEKNSRIFQLIPKDGFVCIAFKGFFINLVKFANR